MTPPRARLRAPASVALGTILALSIVSDARALSTLVGTSDFTLTLTSIDSFGTLGINVLVTSVAEVSHTSSSFTPIRSTSAIPTLTTPPGLWALNDRLRQVASVGGLAGDVAGASSASLATTGTLTLKNFSDAPTTFHFAWALNLDGMVTQGGTSPENDYALAQADFSITDDLGGEPIPAGLVAVNTFQPSTHETDVRSGDLSYTLQGGQTRVLTVKVDASGFAQAIDVPEPGISALLSAGTLLLIPIARSRRAGR